MGLPDTMRQYHHHARSRDRIHREIQVLTRAGVAPMEILEHEDYGSKRRAAQRQRAQRIEQPFAAR